MAHIAKYKAPSCGHMLAHYTRSKDAVLERENIDQTRTHLNYTVSYYQKGGETYIGKVPGQASWGTIKKRMERVSEATGRRIRKDAVVMADMVITAPKNVPQRDLERFFFLSYQYMAKQVGGKNLMGGYVHMDETTPHMHVPFTPIKDGKFNYKGMCPRSFYKQFHKGLGDHLEKALGYRPEIELSEERREEKVLSSVPQADLDQARAAVLGTLEAERFALESEYREKDAELEAVKRELAIAEERAAGVSKALEGAEATLEDMKAQRDAVVVEIAEESERLERLRRDVAGRAREIGEVRETTTEVRQQAREAASEVVGAGNRIIALARRIAQLRDRVVTAVKAVPEKARDKFSRVRGGYKPQPVPTPRVQQVIPKKPGRRR